MKSTNMSSATGRIPAVAAPIAAPMNADSEIGVSSTRPGNLWYSPFVTPSTPPQASISPGDPSPPALSSPMTMTLSSRSISWARASLIASRTVVVRAMASLRSVADVDVGEQICLGRRRGGLCLRDGPVDHGCDLGIDGVEVGPGELTGLGRPRGETPQAVQLGARVLDLVGAVGLLVALEVAEVAGELHLQERRAAPLPGAGDRLARRLVHREEVEAVDNDAGHAEPGGTVGDVVAGHRPGTGCGLGIPVVLGDEDGRQVPHRGQVHRLKRRALVARAVTEERDADAAGALDLGGQRRPADQRRPAADDAVGPEHALGQVGDVHRAALAVAASGLAPVDLGHHLADVDALGDAVAVTAVGAGDRVTVIEVAAYTDRGSLLTRVQVDESGNLAGRELGVHAFFELADRPHHPVGAQQLPPGQGSLVHRVGHVLLLNGRCAQLVPGRGPVTVV